MTVNAQTSPPPTPSASLVHRECRWKVALRHGTPNCCDQRQRENNIGLPCSSAWIRGVASVAVEDPALSTTFHMVLYCAAACVRTWEGTIPASLGPGPPPGGVPPTPSPKLVRSDRWAGSSIIGFMYHSGKVCAVIKRRSQGRKPYKPSITKFLCCCHTHCRYVVNQTNGTYGSRHLLFTSCRWRPDLSSWRPHRQTQEALKGLSIKKCGHWRFIISDGFGARVLNAMFGEIHRPGLSGR